MLALAERIIVVVGGTTGLGLSAAQSFASAGARLVIVGRSPETLQKALEQLGETAHGICGDATRSDFVGRAISIAVEKFGGFHGLYHVAGGSGRRFGDGPLHELTDEGLDQTLNLNLKSLIYSNRAAVQQFIRQKSGGVVLNISSVLAYSPSPKYFATHAYAAAKSAIVGFTKSAAAYYAPQNIRFNVIAPALVDTPMATRAVANEEITRYIRSKQPLDGGRVGATSDLDAAALFFMSDESRFVTGQVLSIDGGWSVCEGQYG
jgi:NAD(P)-dependent dehydrogenase (short-subunit alcohol dehydrogenase family)